MGFGFFQEEEQEFVQHIIYIYIYISTRLEGVGPGISADLGAKHIQLHENRVVNQDDELYAAQQAALLSQSSFIKYSSREK